MAKKKMTTQPSVFKNKDIIFATVFILFGIIIQLNDAELLSFNNLKFLWTLLTNGVQKLLELFVFLFTSIVD